MADHNGQAELAVDIDAARLRLLEFTSRCGDADWAATPSARRA
jgi:hypothetical protein